MHASVNGNIGLILNIDLYTYVCFYIKGHVMYVWSRESHYVEIVTTHFYYLLAKEKRVCDFLLIKFKIGQILFSFTSLRT